MQSRTLIHVVSRVTALMLVVAALEGAVVRARGQGTEGHVPVAVLDDVEVHEADLIAWWQAHEAVSYAKVRQEWYDGRRRALDALLGDYLLRRAAITRGMSVDALLAEELPKRTEPVTDDEIRQVYERSLPLPGGVTFEDVRPMAVAYLQQQHVNDARGRFVDDLRAAARPVIRLEAPRQRIDVGIGDPVRGPAAAPIQLVEFADFECPYCRQLESVLSRLHDIYGERVRLVWKDFPLSIHHHAQEAAEAARCAGDQGRFWEYHDLLFANQQALTSADLRRHADTAKLDPDQFTACLAKGTHRADIVAGLEEGARHGVSATPILFINGRPVIGAQPIEVYRKVIDEELSR